MQQKLGRPGLIKFLRGFAKDLFYWRVDKYAPVIGVKPLGGKDIGSTGKMGLVQCAERAEFFVAAYFCTARSDRLRGGTRAVPYRLHEPQPGLLAESSGCNAGL